MVTIFSVYKRAIIKVVTIFSVYKRAIIKVVTIFSVYKSAIIKVQSENNSGGEDKKPPRNQKTDLWCQKPDMRNQKPEVRTPKPEVWVHDRSYDQQPDLIMTSDITVKRRGEYNQSIFSLDPF